MRGFKDEILLWLMDVVLIMLIMPPVVLCMYIWAVCREFFRSWWERRQWERRQWEQRQWEQEWERHQYIMCQTMRDDVESKVDWKHEGF